MFRVIYFNLATINAILACNGSSELACLDNLAANINFGSVPILPHLLQRYSII